MDIKRVVTAIAGGLLLVAGVALLVLPGPGVVVIAAGLAVLAREFEWARRPLRIARERAAAGLDQVATSWTYAVADAAFGLLLIGVAAADLIVNLPALGWLSDGFLIASGLFLCGTVIYARRNPLYPR